MVNCNPSLTQWLEPQACSRAHNACHSAVASRLLQPTAAPVCPCRWSTASRLKASGWTVVARAACHKADCCQLILRPPSPLQVVNCNPLVFEYSAETLRGHVAALLPVFSRAQLRAIALREPALVGRSSAAVLRNVAALQARGLAFAFALALAFCAFCNVSLVTAARAWWPNDCHVPTINGLQRPKPFTLPTGSDYCHS